MNLYYARYMLNVVVRGAKADEKCLFDIVSLPREIRQLNRDIWERKVNFLRLRLVTFIAVII